MGGLSPKAGERPALLASASVLAVWRWTLLVDGGRTWRSGSPGAVTFPVRLTTNLELVRKRGIRLFN